MSEPALTGSVSVWITGMKRGDQNAIASLCERYFAKLTQAAKRKLGPSTRGICDGDDIAVEAFTAMCRGAASGRFKKLNNRGDLWRILVCITSRLAAELHRSESRLKRGGKYKDEVPLEAIVSPAPAVDFRMILEEEEQRLLSILRDDRLRGIARGTLAGATAGEIALTQGILPRTVRRKQELIRLVWSFDCEIQSRR